MTGTGDSKMSEGKGTGPSLAGVAQTCAKTAAELKGVGDALSALLKTVTILQNSTSTTHSQAESNLKSIQENAEEIQAIKGRTNLLQEKQEDQNRGLDECLARIESLEKNQSLFRMLDDQDAKISQLERKISPSEFAKGSCIITLHGIPLSKSISEMDIGNPTDVNIIANAFMEGLGKDTAAFIFASDEEGVFTNMAGWARIPENDNFKYSAKTPAISKNSVIFYFRDRVQTIHFEAKIRGALISTQARRRAGDFSFLEMAIYAESSRVRALKNLLLYKGKILVENLTQFSHYRTAWRGGATKSSQAPARLVLELKASREFMETKRKEYFFNEEGTMIRNAWTDQSNIKISEADQTWFSKKPEINQRAESRLVDKATPKPGQSAKRSRESPGLAGNASKQTSGFKCKNCELSFRSRVGLIEHVKEKHSLVQYLSDEAVSEDEDTGQDGKKDVQEVVTAALVTTKGADDILVVNEEAADEQEGEDDNAGFSPPNTKKDKKLAGRKSRISFKGSVAHKATSLPLQPTAPDLQGQKKITSSFASIAKKPAPSSIPNAMPVPKIFSKMGE